MRAKPGATSANNRMARGLVRVDPNIQVNETQGLVMRAAIVVDSVDFVKSPAVDGKLLSDVSIRLHGRVRSLTCDHLPGAEGVVTRFVFGEPKRVDSGDDVIEHNSDVRPDTSINTSMPSVTIMNNLSYEQLYVLGAKGGFVNGYEDEAVRNLNDALSSRTLINVPLRVTYLDAAPYIEFVDIEDPHDIEIGTGDLGYDFVQFLSISEEMSNNPQHTVQQESQKVPKEVESISIADVYEQELVGLEDEVEDETEAALSEEETQAEASASMPDYVGPQGYSAEDHIASLDEDYVAVHDILAEIRGMKPVEQEQPEIHAAKPEPAHMQASNNDIDFGDDEDDISFDDADEDVHEDVKEPARDKFEGTDEDIYATVDLSFDDIDDVLDHAMDESEKQEQDHRSRVDEQMKTAVMDMGNDGAKSVASAQLNEPDPRFADEFGDLDI